MNNKKGPRRDSSVIRAVIFKPEGEQFNSQSHQACWGVLGQELGASKGQSVTKNLRISVIVLLVLGDRLMKMKKPRTVGQGAGGISPTWKPGWSSTLLSPSWAAQGRVRVERFRGPVHHCQDSCHHTRVTHIYVKVYWCECRETENQNSGTEHWPPDSWNDKKYLWSMRT